MHLILLGPRACGKTTVGRALALRLGCSFIDLDDRTRGVLGAASVADAWREHGETAFRQAESRALSLVLNEPVAVISLGGGTPTAPDAPALLQQARDRGASLIYLRASAATLRARLAGETADRPSLTGADPVEEVDAVLARRAPLYESLATITVDVDALDVPGVCNAILSGLGR